MECAIWPSLRQGHPQIYSKKTFEKRIKCAEFNLKDRLEMATIYYLMIALILSTPLLIFFANLYFSIIALTGFMIYSMYVAFPYIPVRSGFVKVVLGELVFLLCITALSTLLTGEPFGLQYLVIELGAGCSGDRCQFQQYFAHLQKRPRRTFLSPWLKADTFLHRSLSLESLRQHSG